jgi:hypothetical protein
MVLLDDVLLGVGVAAKRSHKLLSGDGSDRCHLAHVLAFADSDEPVALLEDKSVHGPTSKVRLFRPTFWIAGLPLFELSCVAWRVVVLAEEDRTLDALDRLIRQAHCASRLGFVIIAVVVRHGNAPSLRR